MHVTRAATVGAALAAAESLVAAAWLTSSPASVVAIVQVVVLTLLAIGVFVARYLVLRTRLHDEIAWEAVAAERSRIAEELHDALGHELSLLAVRAGALQVSHPEAAGRSELIRLGAERATVALREIVNVLPAPTADPRLAPATIPLPRLIEDARAAGLNIDATLAELDGLPAIVVDTVQKIVREALTNAGRHAPSQSIGLRIQRADDVLIVSISNPVGERHPPSTERGTGLDTLRRRLAVLGGSLDAGAHAGRFSLRAVLPCQPVIAPLTSHRPSLPRRRVLLPVGLPAAALLAVVIGYYAWAVHGATTDPATVGRIRVGMTDAAADRLLPGRQAPVRLSTPAEPPGAQACHYYTDGNFPIGYAAWRICFSGGVVQSVDDLR